MITGKAKLSVTSRLQNWHAGIYLPSFTGQSLLGVHICCKFMTMTHLLLLVLGLHFLPKQVWDNHHPPQHCFCSSFHEICRHSGATSYIFIFSTELCEKKKQKKKGNTKKSFFSPAPRALPQFLSATPSSAPLRAAVLLSDPLSPPPLSRWRSKTCRDSGPMQWSPWSRRVTSPWDHTVRGWVITTDDRHRTYGPGKW